MQSKYFWNQWPKADRNLYIVFLSLFGVGLIAMLIANFLGLYAYLDWNTLVELDKTSVIIDVFKVGPFSLTQSVEAPYFLQKFDGTAPLISSVQYYIFASILALSASVLIAVISNFSKYWYFIGVSLFTFFLVSLKLELLLLFDSNQKIGLITAIALYLPVSFYFNQINTSWNLSKRILAFLGITALLGVFFYFTASTPKPFFYLATSMTSAATVLSLIFVLSVAHEIVAGFAYILFGTGTNTTKNGTGHFLIISVIYLTNVVLSIANEMHWIDWDILYINPFILLFISAVLGIWGFKHRENQYENIVSFKLSGALGFTAVGLICFTTIWHFYSIGNDAGLEIFRDIILYAHFGYGLIFVLYILANFAALLKSKLAIYKVVYKPTNMPYFTFRLAGTIVVIAFILKSNWQVPVFQNAASNYNSIADYHYNNGENALAERYFKEASEYALHNHKSNYAMAVINERLKNEERAIIRYQEAIKKYPSPQAYVNLSKIYSKQNRFFDALFTIKDGYQQFPDNSEVVNSLGLMYGKTKFLDSAFYYLNEEAIIDQNSGAASCNLLALLAANDLDISVDSVIAQYIVKNDPVSMNNTLVLSNKNKLPKDFSYDLTDSTLSTIDISILTNQFINKLFKTDTIDAEILNYYAQYKTNYGVREGLEYLYCIHKYKNQNINTAFRKLNWMANTSEKISAKYFDDIGLWALEQNAPDVASQYFAWSLDRGYSEAQFHLAIALTESLNPEALSMWKSIYETGKNEYKDIAEKMIQILTASVTDLTKDYEKYLFSKYRLNYGDTLIFNDLISSIEDPNYKAKGILDMCQKLWNRDLQQSTLNTYDKIAGLELTDKNLFDDIQFFELNMLAYNGQIRDLAKKINQGVEFDISRSIEKALYTGLIAHASNDSTLAKKQFEYIGARNPFYEESVIATANYYHDAGEPFKAYELLLSAMEINPNSIKLLKAYVYQCARIEHDTYGTIGLENLKPLITNQEYRIVKENYDKLLQEAATAWLN